MRSSTDRILTTHVGALPAAPGIWTERDVDELLLIQAVDDVVRQQRACGVDIVNEGELTKSGHWTQFVNSRLSGFEAIANNASIDLLMDSDDWREYSHYYKDAAAGGTLFESTRGTGDHTASIDGLCTGPIRYVGQRALQREIDCLNTALGGISPDDAFLTSTAPASLEPGRENRHYPTQEAFVYALADAMSVEYKAIVDAGFLLQIDDAWLAALWDRIGTKMGLAAYQRYCALRVEALNHALRGIPEDRVRYHLCWGSWHGPHSRDIPMADIVDTLLSVKAQAYLFEAANARHEHEFTIWEHVRLPDSKILVPGVVSHATTLIEHPELVSMRIQRFANIVGRERVMAGTDCGLGLRCHPQIAWGKLKALAEGAALASKALWGRRSTA